MRNDAFLIVWTTKNLLFVRFTNISTNRHSLTRYQVITYEMSEVTILIRRYVPAFHFRIMCPEACLPSRLYIACKNPRHASLSVVSGNLHASLDPEQVSRQLQIVS